MKNKLNRRALPAAIDRAREQPVKPPEPPAFTTAEVAFFYCAAYGSAVRGPAKRTMLDLEHKLEAHLRARGEDPVAVLVANGLVKAEG